MQNISRGSLEPLKLTFDIDTYIYNSQHGKYIIKYFKLPAAMARMSRTKELLTAIKQTRTDFPCIVPERVCETASWSIYIEEYVDGILMGKADFSEDEMRSVYAQIVGCMRDLREIGCYGYATGGFSWKEFMSEFTEKRIAAVMELGLWEMSVFREFRDGQQLMQLRARISHLRA